MNPSSLETIYRMYEENKRLAEENEALRLKVQKLKARVNEFRDDPIYTLEDSDHYRDCECSESEIAETEYLKAFTRTDMPTCSECGGKVCM